MICIILLSGCIDGLGGYYAIDVELLSTDDINEIGSDSFLNITHMDLSTYPTLSQAITFLLDPSTNQHSVLLETPKEEWDRIQSDIGSSYIIYYRYYFSIGYVLS